LRRRRRRSEEDGGAQEESGDDDEEESDGRHGVEQLEVEEAKCATCVQCVCGCG